MNEQPHDLEAKMHRVLRGLPNRRAPSGLEARVLAELGRRAALPWWRKSFAHWPSSVRVAFLGLSCIAATLLVYAFFVVGNTPGAHAVSGGISGGYHWYQIARDYTQIARDQVRMAAASVPPLWLYGGAVVIALSYASVAALGAAAFRALSPSRQTS